MDGATACKEDYLTEAQLCAMLGVTPRTTRKWRCDNSGPDYVRAGLRRILYRRRDVEVWLASRTFRHRAAEITSVKQAA